jgi:hypothetical protein
VRNRHHADCRVAAERYTLICDGPEIRWRLGMTGEIIKHGGRA